MKGSRKIGLLLRVTIAVWSFTVFAGTAAFAATLNSQFFSNDSDALQVMDGTSYDMNDPAWRDSNHNQNRDTFAYKLFAGLFMLGYQTEMEYLHGGLDNQHLLALKAFQSRNALPLSTLVDSACLQMIDQQLVQREQALAPPAQAFPLYDHMQPLHPNDISKDALATIYSLPMSVLPQYLQMSPYELVQCIGGQCDGFIQDAYGNNLDSWPTPIDPTSDYRFVGAYFDPLRNNSRLPSAAVHVDTVLHEYAHYLDGFLFKNKDPLQPKLGMIDTSGFYAIAYDLDSGTYCYTLKSSDPKDWITKYAAQFNGYGNCPAGQSVVFEDWAESFSMYVAAGRDFRTAAGQSAMIARKYDWLKTNVFNGLEYDTDLPRDLESGCNDVYGTASVQPGYAHCNDNYIWDFTLPFAQNSIDTSPDPFIFTPRTDADPATAVVSAPVVIKGINMPAPVSISGGEYSINGGAFVSTAGVVNFNDAVSIRLVSSASFNASAAATLTIGGVDGTFSVTTRTNILPTIAGSPATSGVVGTPYTFTPTASNASGFSVSGNIPPGLNFNTANGTLSGTPTVPGDYGSIIIAAVNANGAAPLPAFSISVVLPLPTISGSPVTNVTVGTPYTFTPTAPFASAFTVSGNIPPGLNFNTATGTLSGTPTTNGDYADIVITANNITGSAALPAFSISVRPPLPTIWAFPMTSGTVGTPYGGFYIWSTNAGSFTISGTVPPGLIFDTSTCPATLDGTPTTPGVYDNIIITAVNSAGSTSLPAFSITVKLPLPAISGSPASIAVLGTPYASFTPSSTYAANFTITGALPPGLDFDTTTGTLSGTPTAVGSYGNIVIAALNSEGSTPLPAFAITVFPVMDSFKAGGPMITPRQYHTATLLGNGKVLVAGGTGATGVLASAELYDPATNSWSAAGSMNSTRAGHAASLLPGGRVLVAGGYDAYFNILASAELYDPATNSWSPAASMTQARSDYTATLLSSGRVLVTGGSGDNSAEMYDPGADKWVAAGSMLTMRYLHTVTSLSNGKVLAAGGYDFNNGYLASAELYDPSSNSWSAAGAMAAARQSHSATLLTDGRVLVAGGYDLNNGYLAIAEIYDPVTDKWSAAGSMTTPRLNQSATLLPGGKVLVAGGSDGTSVLSGTELYSPDTTPDPFAFASRTGVNLTTVVESDPVVISGIDGPAAVSISSGEYAITADGGLTWGGWSNTGGTVNPHEQIRVRQTSASKARTTTTTILMIGGVEGSFDVTTADLPGAPIMAGVVAGNALVAVLFAPPLANGGSAITGYTVTANPGGKTVIGTTSPLTVTGLNNGTPYTFTVTATNAVGTSAASAVSGIVIPAASTMPTVTITANAKPANPSNLAGGRIGFSGMNALSFRCKLDNGTYAPCTSPYDYNGVADGYSHTFSVQSFNADDPPKASAVATYTWKVDTTPPAVSAFTVADPSPKYVKSQKISITAFKASDNIGGCGLAGYMITESDVAPLAGASGWSPAKPANYTTVNTGSVMLYAWVKDRAGNISTAFAPQKVNIDITKPTVDSFTITATVKALTVPVTSFTANDLGGSNVAGYLITTTATAPPATAAGWGATAPTSYSFKSAGTKTLYAWAKDGAGNISLPKSATVKIQQHSSAGKISATGI